MNSENKYNPRDCYTRSGTFDSELYFVYLYNSVPSRYEHEVKHTEDIDFEKIQLSEFQKFFKETISTFRKYSYTLIDTDTESLEEVDFSEKMEYDTTGGSITFAIDSKVIFIGSSKVVIYYNPTEDYQAIRNLAKDIYELCPKEAPEEQKSKVSLIKVYQGDYYTESASIKSLDVDVTLNYNDDFAPVYDDILTFLRNDSSGLILLYGDMGTGKSSIIRHLCTIEPKDYIIVPQSLAPHLGDPELISFVVEHKGAIFILEDCEQILEDRANNSWNSAISTILNMSDGLTGDIANVKFICTFNAPVTKIDPALLRKGRCAAKYEFKALTADKVEKLNEKYSLNLPEIKPMTLAEIFNSESTDYSEDTKKRKIGF